MRPLSMRSPSLESMAGRTVSEPTIATPTTRIVPVAIEAKPLSPVKYMPAMAAMTVKPEISTARPDVAAAAASAASAIAARPALLALAADVEERVVDADGEADEHDHRGEVLRRGRELADAGHEAHGGHHGGDAEQQRQAGGDERAEREQQDHQRDRQRERLGLLEVVLEHLRDGLAGAGVAELLDAQLGVRLLGGGGGGEDRVDLAPRPAPSRP